MKKLAVMVLACVLLAAAAFAAAEENTQVKHYLLLGEDGYAEDVVDDARTDTIVIVSLDEKYNRVIMTSVLRDSVITGPKGNQLKINLLYRYYGFTGIEECIGKEMGITFEGSVLVNFENVKPAIDALGGVDITIDENEYISIKKILLGKDPNMPKGPGLVHMTGRIALAYMRDRKSGSGDFSRTERQRKVVSQLFSKCRDLSLMELIGIYNDVSAGMKMSLSVPAILAVLRSGYSLLQNGASFAEFRVPQNGTYSYGTADVSGSSLNVRWKTNRERFHALLDTDPKGE